MRKERRLLSLRRLVSGDRAASYRLLWDALSSVATEEGAHAWRFVSPNDPALHLEFLEFDASADPRLAMKARALLDRLESEVGTSTIEEWLEDR